MLGIQYYKADSSTYVVRTAHGQTKSTGRGLSFFYNAATTSIAAVPVSAQEAPFIFTLQTGDYQEITVQGQLAYQIAEPEVTAEIFNFTLSNKDQSYITEDPMHLSDRVIRMAHALIEAQIQGQNLRDVLKLGPTLIETVRQGFLTGPALSALGLRLLDLSISRIAPTPETSRALEATTREAILQDADDAIYSRRKSAVEQERVIKETELQTELTVQQKEQELAAKQVENERDILRGKTQTEQERIAANISAETARTNLVTLRGENSNSEADAQAYAITAKMQAFQSLPVEHLKAMALAQMQPEQLMAMALESLAHNADKIGELNLGPEIFSSAMQRASNKASRRQAG